jgi:hypothetical protein
MGLITEIPVPTLPKHAKTCHEVQESKPDKTRQNPTLSQKKGSYSFKTQQNPTEPDSR